MATSKKGQRLCSLSNQRDDFHAASSAMFGVHGVMFLSMALRIVSSFRETAVRATLAALPA